MTSMLPREMGLEGPHHGALEQWVGRGRNDPMHCAMLTCSKS